MVLICVVLNTTYMVYLTTNFIIIIMPVKWFLDYILDECQIYDEPSIYWYWNQPPDDTTITSFVIPCFIIIITKCLLDHETYIFKTNIAEQTTTKPSASLIHCNQVSPYGDTDSGQHLVPSVMMNSCNWTFGNNLQWNSSQNTMFILENACQNNVCKIAAILTQYINGNHVYDIPNQ